MENQPLSENNINPNNISHEKSITKKVFSLSVLCLTLVALILISAYFLATNFFLQSQEQMHEHRGDEGHALAVPTGSVRIQACASKKGALYARPEDIPVGPIYMVRNDKVIGIEYMVDREDFLQGKKFINLDGREVVVNHVDIGSFSEGHEGYVHPHYHVTLYNVPSHEKDSIDCSLHQGAHTGTPTQISPTLFLQDDGHSH